MIKISNKAYTFQYHLKYQDFSGTTNVFCYIGKRFIYVCDTFIYPNKMLKIKNELNEKFPDKRFVVFNSHADFDHFWGNSAFENDIIISSCLAEEEMKKNDFSEESKYFKIPELIFPNICFEERIIFPEDEVIFFHTPGHTKGSSSCFFKKEKILFAGDNLEYPYPYIDNNLLREHIMSLEYYKKLMPNIIIPGHGDICYDNKIIDDNLLYLRGKKSGK